LNPKESLLADLINIVERRPMVIGPVVIGNSISEITLPIVGVSFGGVDDPILVAVSLI
jgi:hypothetical protein